MIFKEKEKISCKFIFNIWRFEIFVFFDYEMIRESEVARNMKYLIYSNVIKILEISTLSIVLIKII